MTTETREYAITPEHVNPSALVTRVGVVRSSVVSPDRRNAKVTLSDGSRALVYLADDGLVHVALPSDRAAEVYGPQGGYGLDDSSDEELIAQSAKRGLI